MKMLDYFRSPEIDSAVQSDRPPQSDCFRRVEGH